MRLTRCFVPPPLQEHTQRSLPRAAALHVTRVLRLRAGARLTLFDGRGG
jgi:16S rRNA U1498 N3-methylase RsmE